MKPQDMSPTDRLRLFVARAEELGNTKLAKGEFRARMRFDGIAFQPDFPDEDEFRSLLLAARHFLLQEEPVLFGRVFNVCEEHITSDKHRLAMRSARRGLDERLASSGVGIVVGGKEITPKYAIDLFFYGSYFHGDPEHREFLESVPEEHRPLLKWNLFAGVIGVCEVVFYTAGLLKDCLARGYVSDVPRTEREPSPGEDPA